MADSSVDFAVVAYRDEGVWQVQALPRGSADDIDSLINALRPWPSDTGALGLVSVDDDFFVIARVMGARTQLLLSDVTAATEWELASGVIDLLDLPEPDDDEDPQPAGDLAILADLGVSAMDLGVLCDDEDLYPEDVLADVARLIGFESQFQAAVDAVSV
jgi:putative tRNA adenosine deaminase-associated protein